MQKVALQREPVPRTLWIRWLDLNYMPFAGPYNMDCCFMDKYWISQMG